MLAGLMALAILCLGAGASRAGDLTFFQPGSRPATLQFSAGAFSLFDDGQKDTAPLFQFDAVSRWDIVNFWDYAQVNPYVGGFVTGKSGRMGYLGLHGNIPVGPHFELNPFGGIGLYGRGSGRDLGSLTLFQAGLEILYVFVDGYRAGITFSHESNGQLLPRNHDHCICNPGSDNLLLTVAVPFDKIF
ncbi:MAG TPA: hypothetical protein VKY65_13470 [Alphaproteobacteria bacterium]|nr:hypothetical protein [Alphaproteobacteria bacterium]